MTNPRPTVLVIDDTPTNLVVLARSLAKDFSVQVATSGPSGVSMAESAPPDLILLDVMMPEVDGFETCRRLKAIPKLKSVPIIFVTALTDMQSEVQGLDLGASDYLHKPINIEIARQRIRNLIERETLRREIEAHRGQLADMVKARTSELEQANRDLQAARTAAEAASRAKTIFMANMSHELRTPLGIILGMTHLLSSRMRPEELADKKGKIASSGRRLLEIIDDILLVTKLESGEAAPGSLRMSIPDLLDKVEPQFHAAASAKAIAIDREMPADASLEVAYVPIGVRRVLESFLSNAIKFSERGRVVIRASRTHADDGAPAVRIEVADEGIGIEAGALHGIFEAFSQVDGSLARAYGGIGVGLAIAKHMARVSGAKIGATSTPGKGSCFWICVPTSPESTPAHLSQTA